MEKENGFYMVFMEGGRTPAYKHETLEKATPLSIDTFIPKEFSLAYQDQEETA